MVRLLLQKGYQNSLIKISVKEFALSLIFTFSLLPSFTCTFGARHACTSVGSLRIPDV